MRVHSTNEACSSRTATTATRAHSRSERSSARRLGSWRCSSRPRIPACTCSRRTACSRGGPSSRSSTTVRRSTAWTRHWRCSRPSRKRGPRRSRIAAGGSRSCAAKRASSTSSSSIASGWTGSGTRSRQRRQSRPWIAPTRTPRSCSGRLGSRTSSRSRGADGACRRRARTSFPSRCRDLLFHELEP